MVSAASDMTPRVWKANTHSSLVHTQGYTAKPRHTHVVKRQGLKTKTADTFISPDSITCLSSQITQYSFNVRILSRAYLNN